MSNVKQRILGIDPGFGRIGWGIIEGEKSQWRHVAHGCIETETKDPFLDRLLEIEAALKKIIADYRPTHSAVEELFFHTNVTTAMKVGQARGVILLTLVGAGVQVRECTPLQIKQTMTGYGRADKRQVKVMVQTELGLPAIPTPDDAADALAAALTGAFLYRSAHRF